MQGALHQKIMEVIKMEKYPLNAVFVEKCGNYWYNEETAKLRQFLNDLFGVSKPCRVSLCGFLLY